MKDYRFYETEKVMDKIEPDVLYLGLSVDNQPQIVRMRGEGKQFHLCMYTDWLLINPPMLICLVPIKEWERNLQPAGEVNDIGGRVSSAGGPWRPDNLPWEQPTDPAPDEQPEPTITKPRKARGKVGKPKPKAKR